VVDDLNIIAQIRNKLKVRDTIMGLFYKYNKTHSLDLFLIKELSDEFPEKQLVQEFVLVLENYIQTVNKNIEESGSDASQDELDNAYSVGSLIAYLLYGTGGVYAQSKY
jgi:hypothetical protein